MDFVFPKIFHFSKPIFLKNKKYIFYYNLVYESYGYLCKKKNNITLICHAFNASHHVYGFYKKDLNTIGWWNNIIGINNIINIKYFYIICINNIGSCFGSTGPMSINLLNNILFNINFPIILIEDWINSQYFLIKQLNIFKILSIIGGSLGGMQSLIWSIIYFNRLYYCIIIASTYKLSSQNIALNYISRQSILYNYYIKFNNFYKKNDKFGLNLARMISNINYKSNIYIKKKFNRKLYLNKYNYSYYIDFEIESYLKYKSKKFSKNFNINTYLLITKLLDYFNLKNIFKKKLIYIFKNNKIIFFIITFNTDWRFSSKNSFKIVKNLINNNCFINYCEINSFYGHDSFLLNNKIYFLLLNNIYLYLIKKNI